VNWIGLDELIESTNGRGGLDNRDPRYCNAARDCIADCGLI
jgi:hypothetical protein